MLRILTRKHLKKLLEEKEHQAFVNGYCLGYQTAQSELTGKGFIASNKVRREIAELLLRNRL